MFRFSIHGHTSANKNKRLVAVTDFQDVATFMRDHAGEMLDPTGELGLVFTMQENNAVAQFLPGKRNANPSPAPEPAPVAPNASEEVKEHADL